MNRKTRAICFAAMAGFVPVSVAKADGPPQTLLDNCGATTQRQVNEVWAGGFMGANNAARILANWPRLTIDRVQVSDTASAAFRCGYRAVYNDIARKTGEVVPGQRAHDRAIRIGGDYLIQLGRNIAARGFVIPPPSR